jgi:hypothetical protein
VIGSPEGGSSWGVFNGPVDENTMRMAFLRDFKILLFIALIGFANPTPVSSEQSGRWITEKEASLPAKAFRGLGNKNQFQTNLSIPIERKEPAGPIVEVKKPEENKTYKNSIDILVEILKNPLGGNINMSSLKIIYLKIFEIDITDRVRPYIKGEKIEASNIEFPSGEHSFKILVMDSEEKETSQHFAFVIQ